MMIMVCAEKVLLRQRQKGGMSTGGRGVSCANAASRVLLVEDTHEYRYKHTSVPNVGRSVFALRPSCHSIVPLSFHSSHQQLPFLQLHTLSSGAKLALVIIRATIVTLCLNQAKEVWRSHLSRLYAVEQQRPLLA